MNIIEAMRDAKLFAPYFKEAATWAAWVAFLKAVFALDMTSEEETVYRHHTGREAVPDKPAREVWAIVGRRGGKSRVASLLAIFLACFRDWLPYLAPGEVGTVPVIAADRRQARTIMRYIEGFLAVPMLKRMVVNQTAESVTFKNRTIIEIHTASYRSTRGYTIIAAVCDELAFWRSEESVNPDKEIISGLRPGMATVPGSLLVAISSPYARRGMLWEMYEKHFGKDADPFLVWQSDTRSMNPAVDQRVIDEAFVEDETAASAEFGGQFRRDVESFISKEVLDAVVIPGRHELPPSSLIQYQGFCDPSGGSADSFTLAIAHKERGCIVLDAIREQRPPFSPEQTVSEFCEFLKTYKVTRIVGDAYGGQWPRERFLKSGVEYRVSEQNKSTLYKEALPLLNSGNVELLDHPKLKAQLLGLERRTGRGGKDSIDHPPRGHDDVANAFAGVLSLFAKEDAPLIGIDLEGTTQESPWNLQRPWKTY